MTEPKITLKDTNETWVLSETLLLNGTESVEVALRRYEREGKARRVDKVRLDP